MKNFLVLGLLAALLFSISAALSIWLNQSKTDPNADKDKGEGKTAAKGTKGSEPKESTEPKAAPKVEPPPPGPESAAQFLRDREARLKFRSEQVELVLRDLQVQRDATDAAMRALTAELKTAALEAGKLDLLAEDLRKKKVEFEAGEKKNIEKIAAMYDAMTPDAAAPILKQMADNGKMDMAAKILVQMKERNAARVLEAMNDPALALQVLDKMRGIRAANPPAPGAPGVPAKGP
jgi:flagellar motility protein MotE (MotC chaperone)